MSTAKNTTETTETEFNTLDFIMNFEDGEISNKEIVDGFSQLVKTKIIWSLQGLYQRTFYDLLNAGYLDKSGNILCYPDDLD